MALAEVRHPDHLPRGQTMDVEQIPSVDAALRTLGDEERRQVIAWIDNLRNWDNDPHTRKISKPTGAVPNVYFLNTSDDVRIFFKLDSKRNQITVVDIAKPSRFATPDDAAARR
jgi:hypothetical protein